jgi:hypothetical protein
MTTFPPFARRRNKNSSMDSICTKCFLTIASAGSEEELVPHEEKHICDPYGEFSDAFYDSDMRTHGVRSPQSKIQAVRNPPRRHRRRQILKKRCKVGQN